MIQGMFAPKMSGSEAEINTQFQNMRNLAAVGVVKDIFVITYSLSCEVCVVYICIYICKTNYYYTTASTTSTTINNIYI
jgi:hypothetical protein